MIFVKLSIKPNLIFIPVLLNQEAILILKLDLKFTGILFNMKWNRNLNSEGTIMRNKLNK